MRNALILLILLLSGCVQETATVGNATCPEPEPCDCPTVSNCTSANITIKQVVVQQQCNITESNATVVEPAPLPEQGIEGIPFANGSYLLVLDDVSIPMGSSDSCGIFSMRDASSGSVLDREIICPGESQYWKSPEDDLYRIVVSKVAAGYTKDIKWAEVIIYG